MKKTYNKGGLLTLLGENKEEQQLRKQIQQIEQQYKRDTRGRPQTNFKEVKRKKRRKYKHLLRNSCIIKYKLF